MYKNTKTKKEVLDTKESAVIDDNIDMLPQFYPSRKYYSIGIHVTPSEAVQPPQLQIYNVSVQM